MVLGSCREKTPPETGNRKRVQGASTTIDSAYIGSQAQGTLATGSADLCIGCLKHLESTAVRGKRDLSPASGPQVEQYQGASSCETMWCASSRARRLLLADLRSSNWRAG